MIVKVWIIEKKILRKKVITLFYYYFGKQQTSINDECKNSYIQ